MTVSVAEISDWWTKMQQQTSTYQPAVDALKPILYGLAPRIIAIDGKNGVGKSSLGRYLSWQFKSPIVEIDRYRILPNFDYLTDEIHRLICERTIRKTKPIFVEGIAVRWVLQAAKFRPDFCVYVKNGHESDVNVIREGDIAERLEAYEREFGPESSADLVINNDIDHFPYSAT